MSTAKMLLVWIFFLLMKVYILLPSSSADYSRVEVLHHCLSLEGHDLHGFRPKLFESACACAGYAMQEHRFACWK